MLEILKKFSDVRVLVVGDVMLDRYLWGSVDRISPEAPVPVVNLKKSTFVAGGAANVATNLAALRVNVDLVGIIGQDQDADQLSSVLSERKISSSSLVNTNRPTTVKTRVVAQNQQIVRVDQEDNSHLGGEDEKKVLDCIGKNLKNADVVIISDYAKGVVTENVCSELISSSNSSSLSTIVDPKGLNFSKYKSATILTPNQKETLAATGILFDGNESIVKAGNDLLGSLELNGVIVTRGEHGMSLFEKSKEVTHLSASARKVYDVTGAGDTVVATLGAAIGAGEDFKKASQIANIAAGIVVEKVGTTCISSKELEQTIVDSGL